MNLQFLVKSGGLSRPTPEDVLNASKEKSLYDAVLTASADKKLKKVNPIQHHILNIIITMSQTGCTSNAKRCIQSHEGKIPL